MILPLPRHRIFGVQGYDAGRIPNHHSVSLNGASQHPGIGIHFDFVQVEAFWNAERCSLRDGIGVVCDAVASLRRMRPHCSACIRQGYVERMIDCALALLGDCDQACKQGQSRRGCAELISLRGRREIAAIRREIVDLSAPGGTPFVDGPTREIGNLSAAFSIPQNSQ